MTQSEMIQVSNLVKHYPIKKMFRAVGTVKALQGVSFSLNQGETLAVVGESGCGKTTLAKVLMGIESKTEGQVTIGGQPLDTMDKVQYRKTLQMIFQDPYSSINPRKRAWEIIAEPLVVNDRLDRKQLRNRAIEMMQKVGLRPEFADRYPHMFSGGQRQRIGIARALIMNPKVIICDEPVSALDVSIQAQILNLLLDLQDELKLSYLFISHDLAVVEHISDKVMVIYLGQVVEYGNKSQIFSSPQHPYTQTLLASTPKLNGSTKDRHRAAQGELPSRLATPKGCPFSTRCPFTQDICRDEAPALREVNGRQVSCHFAGQVHV